MVGGASLRVPVALVASALSFLVAAPAGAVTITEFSTASVPGEPLRISPGPGGDLWFTSQASGAGADALGRVTTAGTVSHFPLAGGTSDPADLVYDGTTLYFTEVSGEIGRTAGAAPTETSVGGGPAGIAVTGGKVFVADFSAGTLRRFAAGSLAAEATHPTGGGNPIGIVPDGSGSVYYTDLLLSRIGRVSTSAANGAATTVYPAPLGGQPHGITVGPGAEAWFALLSSNAIGRMTSDGTFTPFPLPNAGSAPIDIVLGPDGALWFSETNANRIGRITTDGQITEYTLPTAGGTAGIAVGPDNAIWFTKPTTDQVGRLVPDPPAPPLTDTTPPETTIDKAPKRKSAKRKAKIKFSANEQATFACKLDKGGFAPCTSPYKKKVKAGRKHKFQVVATDAAGNADLTPAKARWKVQG